VTLLFSDTKNLRRRRKALLNGFCFYKSSASKCKKKPCTQKKEVFGDVSEFIFFPRRTKGQIKMPFLCSDFNNTFHETTRMRKGFRSERRRR